MLYMTGDCCYNPAPGYHELFFEPSLGALIEQELPYLRHMATHANVACLRHNTKLIQRACVMVRKNSVRVSSASQHVPCFYLPGTVSTRHCFVAVCQKLCCSVLSRRACSFTSMTALQKCHLFSHRWLERRSDVCPTPCLRFPTNVQTNHCQI